MEHGISTDIYTMIDSMRLEKQTGRTQPIYAPPGQLVSSSFDKFMPNGGRRTRSSLDATKFENHRDDEDDDDNEHDASSIASDSLFTTYTTATTTPFLVFEQEDDDASTVCGNGMPSPTTVRTTFAATATTTTPKPSTSRHLKLRGAARAMTNRQNATSDSSRRDIAGQHAHYYGDDDDSVFMGVVRQHWDTNWAELGSDSTDSTGSGSGSAEADEDLGASHGSSSSFYIPNLNGQTDALEDRFPTTHNVKSIARPLKQKLQKQQLLSSLPPLEVLGPLPPPHSTHQNRRTGNSNSNSSSRLSRYYYDHLLSSLILYEKVEV
jgi:hypothetical protein